MLLLAACSDPGTQTANTSVLTSVEADQRHGAVNGGRILCARVAEALRRTCTVEQGGNSRGLILTVRHEDGGFHRLLVTRDGRRVVAADGALPARIAIRGGEIEVALGGDHYRLPATVKRGS